MCRYFQFIFLQCCKITENPVNGDLLENVIDIDGPILAATEQFKRLLSTYKIKEKAKIKKQFCFKHVTCTEVKRIINDINHKKPLKKVISQLKLLRKI